MEALGPQLSHWFSGTAAEPLVLWQAQPTVVPEQARLIPSQPLFMLFPQPGEPFPPPTLTQLTASLLTVNSEVLFSVKSLLPPCWVRGAQGGSWGVTCSTALSSTQSHWSDSGTHVASAQPGTGPHRPCHQSALFQDCCVVGTWQ